MIRLPQRSVTRFFIPLIDVLILLFCIFLLMPIVRAPGEEASPEVMAARDERIRELEREMESLRAQKKPAPVELSEQLERLRREKIESLQNHLAIRVLEIDPATGRLYYNDPERTEVRNAEDARALIELDRFRQKERQGRRELYYLILFPRDRTSPFPTRGQRERYERWFADIAHGWDIPATPGPGGAP